MRSTRYYDTHAERLSEHYDGMEPDRVHRGWVKEHLPDEPGFACDIGAGSGRDANWLADLGWDVVAVEPSNRMRYVAEGRARPGVIWLDDALPDLSGLRALGDRFDLILLSAVWMHVAQPRRERAFKKLSELLKPGGVLVITLRHGQDEEENAARGFHEVSADELIEYATSRALHFTSRSREPDTEARQGVSWETLVFTMPQDGSGSLPLLRHIIINDNMSSSYKLGLLRTLTRIAESARGMAVQQDEDHVRIPLGLVGLYWLKQYKPLLLGHSPLPQRPGGRGDYGFVGDDFNRLKDISGYDLRVGGRFDPEHGAIVTGAIRDACRTIKQMPARYITYPGGRKPVFEIEWRTVRRQSASIILSPDYFWRFGAFLIPTPMWQTLGQYACWLEPTILREWSDLVQPWTDPPHRSVATDVFDWEEGVRNTDTARGRFMALKEAGQAMPCVWSASRLRLDQLQIDHCFPWSRWFNNDLWNLVPSNDRINRSKGDKLPSASTLAGARERMMTWWQQAYLDSSLEERFLIEAGASLPTLAPGDTGLAAIYESLKHQRARLKADQQLPEWTVR